MNVMDILKSLFTDYKVINTKDLPSQGLFYDKDFDIKIKKADIEDIIEYEHKFDKDNLLSAIECIKNVVNRNVIISNNKFTYDYIKSVDIIFIFLEIVKFTTGKEIEIPYIDINGKERIINFSMENFNYFDFSEYMKSYNETTREFEIDDYRFSLPSIGLETSLTNYLISNQNKNLSNLSYDFMFFLCNKSIITIAEIENLIQIFNYDIDGDEINKIRSLIDKFKNIVSYSLVVEDSPLEIKSKINLCDIWKFNI